MTSYLDTGANSGGAFAVQAWDRGKWVDAAQDPTTGFVTLSAPRTRRTPWYMQTDFSISQNFKITESKVLSFSVDATNLLNQGRSLHITPTLPRSIILRLPSI